MDRIAARSYPNFLGNTFCFLYGGNHTGGPISHSNENELPQASGFIKRFVNLAARKDKAGAGGKFSPFVRAAIKAQHKTGGDEASIILSFVTPEKKSLPEESSTSGPKNEKPPRELIMLFPLLVILPSFKSLNSLIFTASSLSSSQEKGFFISARGIDSGKE